MSTLGRVLRVGVLLTVFAGLAVLLIATARGSQLTVEVAIPALGGAGALGGVISSVRYLTVRLAVIEDATSVGAATGTWGQLRGLLGDAGWSVLLGGAGWVVVCMVRAASLPPGQAVWGDALAFFLLGAMWLAGFLGMIVAVFLVWMPVAVFVAEARARRRGQRARGSWSVLAWCLVGLDLLILLMVANAVFVPTNEGHEPWSVWQTILFLVTNTMLVLLSFAFVAAWIFAVLPSRSQSTRRAARRKRKPGGA